MWRVHESVLLGDEVGDWGVVVGVVLPVGRPLTSAQVERVGVHLLGSCVSSFLERRYMCVSGEKGSILTSFTKLYCASKLLRRQGKQANRTFIAP